MKILTAVAGCLLMAGTALGVQSGLPQQLSEQTRECVECHAGEHPGIYQQWGAGTTAPTWAATSATWPKAATRMY